MLRLIIMTISLIAVVAVNGAANIVPFNGNTTVEISNRLPILLTPASYVLLIWPVIYLLLTFWLFGVWVNRTNKENPMLNRRVFYFTLSSFFNIAWIVLWHYEYFTWTFVTMAALLVTLIAFYYTYPKNENSFYERVPIAVYLGWIVISFISNISYLLTLHEWHGWGLSTPLWTVIFLTIATAIALHFMYHHSDIAFNFVFIWVFVGIAVKNGFEELFVSAAALFLTLVIVAATLFLPKKNRIAQSKKHHI